MISQLVLHALVMLILRNAALAAPACYDRNISGYGKLIQKVAEYADSKTSRQTIDDYAHTHDSIPPVIEQKTAATGKLNCKSGEVSANLVIKGDLLLTVDHAFVDRKTCNVLADPKDCSFQIPGKRSIKVANLVASGNKCPKIEIHNTDWAVLRLESVVEGVTPYKIKTMGARDTISPQGVVAVGASSVDFRRRDPKTKQLIQPKHLQDCEIKGVFYRYDPVTLASNCEGSYGKSGGALLERNLSEPTIIGMSVGNSLTEKEGQAETKTARPVRKKYDEKTWRDAGVGITGELYDALVQASK